MNDIVLNKKESIERCIKQIRAYYESPSETDFKKDFFKQDAIAINLQRACEQCIDLANHAIKSRKLGLPKGSKESFLLLSENKIIPKVLSTNMEKMVGFRNTLVYQYQQLDTDLMMDVIENHLDDLLDFTNMIAQEFAE